METKFYRMNSNPTSNNNSTATLNSEQELDDQQSTNYVQSSTSITTSAEQSDLLLDSNLVDSPTVTCSSFINHQTSLPCSSGESRPEFENVDSEFDAQFTNSSMTVTQPQNTATSLSSFSNNLSDSKVVDYSIDRSPLINTFGERFNTPPPSKSPDHQYHQTKPNSNKLLSNVPDNIGTDELVPKVDSLLIERLTVEQFREQLTEQFNQQILNQEIFNQQILNQNVDYSKSGDENPEFDDEDCSESCSSEEEKSDSHSNPKKRSRSPHLCSKKRRKQSNPIQLKKDDQLEQKMNDANLESSDLININNLKNLQRNLESESSSIVNRKSDEDEPEEGLLRFFPNSLSAAANASARFFFSNHKSGSLINQTVNNNKVDDGESHINYTYYLAAAAAVATRASMKNTKHCLNYCKECCCPFLSTEHEKLYRKLEKEKENKSNQEKSSAFAQQLQKIAQQSKLMQEIEAVFGNSNDEAGQLPQKNAIDAMQLIKQLESGQLDNEEAKVYQQQLTNLLNSSIFNTSNTNNQIANSLSALLAGRVFNPEAYCVECKKSFCNKYFLKKHRTKKHAIQSDTNKAATENKCISPTSNPVQLLEEYSGVLNSSFSTGQISNPEVYCTICKKIFCNKYFLKQHKQNLHNEGNGCLNNQNKSPVSLSPKRDQTAANQQQLQYELMNAIASSEKQPQTQPVVEEVQAVSNPTPTLLTTNDKHKDEAIRNQLSLQQILSNATANVHFQQLNAVLQAESFANILRQSIVQQNSTDLSTADLVQMSKSTNANFLFTPVRLREMGVSNPEAFCSWCAKEFSILFCEAGNKYFLKKHMANKHSVHAEDDCGSSSCDSQANNSNDHVTEKANRTNNSKNEMCNLDDDALEPGQCPSTINQMNLTTLLMINNLKQQQQQQINNNQISKESPVQQAINEEPVIDYKSTTSNPKTLCCEQCPKTFSNSNQLKMHQMYYHKKEDSRNQEKADHQIDRNNNSNEPEMTILSKEHSNNETTGLDLNNQAIYELQQNGDLLKFQQMIKELQQHSEADSETTELLRKLALIHKQTTINAPKEENNLIYCEYCEKEFKNRSALRLHNCCAANESRLENNRLADSPNSMFSNLSNQMTNTVLNNSNNSNLNYAPLNGDSESLVNQTANNNNLNISSNGCDVLNNNPLLNNLNSSGSNSANPNRFSPGGSSNQSNPLLANLTQNLPQNLPTDVTQSIFFSPTAGITLDLNKQLKFVTGRNYCNKYFMKTHMLKMHNINIDEHPVEAAANSIVGGVMCDICQKELCSKYFLKVHKQNTHGIYEEGGIPVTNPQQQLMTSNSSVQSSDLSTTLTSTQSNQSPNSCSMTATNGLTNQSAVVNTLNPLLSSVYEAGLSKEQQQQLQQIRIEMSKQSPFLNGNSSQSNFLDHQQSNATVPFNNLQHQTISPNCCSMTATNGLTNQSAVVNTLNPLLSSVYEAGLSKEQQQQLQQIRIEMSKQSPFLNGNSSQSNFLDHQQSNATVPFNNLQHQTISPNCTNNNGQITDRNEKESFYLRGIDPSDTTNRYFNQYTEECRYCKRRFKSIKWMKTHVMNEHQNLVNTQSPTNRTKSNDFSDKIRCIFCPKIFTDNNNLNEHLVSDHRTSLQEMILARSIANNYGQNDGKIEKNDSIHKLDIGQTIKTDASLEFFGQQNKLTKKNQSADESKGFDDNHSEQSDLDNSAKEEKSTNNLSNIIQMMQKVHNGNHDQSDDEDEPFNDDESMSEEEKFAAMLNSAQLQQLLMSSSTKSTNTNQSQASISANSNILNLYGDVIDQQQLSIQEQTESNFSSVTNNRSEDQSDVGGSDYGRFNKVVQQNHQQSHQQPQQQPARRNRQRGNTVHTKVYQCNLCDYHTPWLSNLYAHEKRRHNTCSSSQGNLKVITIRQDVTSPSSNVTNFRSNTQINLNNLLNGLESNNTAPRLSHHQAQSNPIDSDLMNQLNDFNNNPNSFMNHLLQSNDSKITRQIKERTASGDGKYMCTICTRTYRHKHSLQRHLIFHREGNSSQANKINQDTQQTTAMTALNNFKQEQASPISNDLSNNLFTQPSNGTSTPSFSTGGRSSVDREFTVQTREKTEKFSVKMYTSTKNLASL